MLTLDQLRTVEWGRSHLWEVYFGPGDAGARVKPPPEPFRTWFPAMEVVTSGFELETTTLSFPSSKHSVPTGKGELTLSIKFVDDINGTLYEWLRSWGEAIVQENFTLLTLPEMCLSMTLNRIGFEDDKEAGQDNLPKAVRGITYMVYPTGKLPWIGTSDPSPVTYTVSFIVAGIGN